MSKREIWIGTIEVKELPGSDFLEGRAGAFVVVTTWANSSAEYSQKVAAMLREDGLMLLGIEDCEPWASKAARQAFDTEIEDMIEQTEDDPAAVICGTFYRYPRVDA